jgi:electron-transferring-flavoprotein dehydrogenase
VPKIKGSHTVMKSGMVAAETIFERLTATSASASASAAASDAASASASSSEAPAIEVGEYERQLRASWVFDELHSVRNVHPAFKWGRWAGMAYSGFSTMLTRGREPWTFRNAAKTTDSQRTRRAADSPPIAYPKADGKLTFDLLTNLARSGTTHDHDQPSHLVVRAAVVAAGNGPQRSFAEFGGPEQNFCPAKVYEYVPDASNPDPKAPPKLQINAQNCLHCKTCSIKTPGDYIQWTVPPGGQGPKYGAM